MSSWAVLCGTYANEIVLTVTIIKDWPKLWWNYGRQPGQAGGGGRGSIAGGAVSHDWCDLALAFRWVSSRWEPADGLAGRMLGPRSICTFV